ncbi:CocE/NonD family hydrolase [Streptomyces sp. NPDC085612]|uniref:CocE/NonD family hydrolase n=1 Tax=Streptomyces sp. NPDC085612 TaxID=3365732 RepID=UPI0037D06CCB
MRCDRDVTVGMRDGIGLLADVHSPAGDGRFPALIAASPCPRQIQDLGAPMGFIEAGASDFGVPRGYAHVIANLRGTDGSGGTFGFFDAQERRDLHDLVEWAADQPWCDGKVGMIGISYFAMAQLEAAVERPAHLRAIFPVAVTTDLWESLHVEALAWFDHWLKDHDTGILDGPPIRYWMPGADEWRTSRTWPARGHRATRFEPAVRWHARRRRGQSGRAVVHRARCGTRPVAVERRRPSHPTDLDQRAAAPDARPRRRRPMPGGSPQGTASGSWSPATTRTGAPPPSWGSVTRPSARAAGTLSILRRGWCSPWPTGAVGATRKHVGVHERRTRRGALLRTPGRPRS